MNEELKKKLTPPSCLYEEVEGGQVTLPITLPFSFVDTRAKIELPLTLPFVFSTEHKERVEKRVPFKEYSLYSRTLKTIKVPLKEAASGLLVKVPISERAYNFEGFILNENVVEKMNSSFSIKEEIRNRVLVDVLMVDRNKLELSWYGERVDEFDIMYKSFVDEEYAVYSTHKWEDKKAVMSLGEDAYHIQIIGKNGSGESFVLEINVSTPLQIKSNATISLNEKIYDIDIDYIDNYRFEVLL